MSATASATSRSRAARRVRTFSTTLDPPLVQREDRTQTEHDAECCGGGAQPPAAAQVVERVDQEPDARRVGRRAAASCHLHSGLAAAPRPGCVRATTPARRRAARTPGSLPPRRGGTCGPIEKRAASSTAKPSAIATTRESTTRTGTDALLRCEPRRPDGARHLARQVDRHDLARARDRGALVGGGERRGWRLRRGHLGATGERREELARGQVDALDVPFTVHDHVGGTTPIPPPLGAPSGRDAVESVTIATVGCSTPTRAGHAGQAGTTLTSFGARTMTLRTSRPSSAPLDVRLGQRQRTQVVVGDVGGHLGPTAHLALHLDDARDRCPRTRYGGSATGNGSCASDAVVAQARPQLLGDVRAPPARSSARAARPRPAGSSPAWSGGCSARSAWRSRC